MSRGTGLLSGVRIVDFTFQAAGAYGAMLLAGLGAEVIKIESVVRSDPTRGRIKDRPYQHSVFFEDVNLGKLSVAVNLKRPEGVDIVRRLIDQSHATMDNFRPGVLTRIGLDPDELMASRPALVCGSLSAAGSTGPYRELPGYAGIFNALSGFGETTGYPAGPPTEMRTSMDMRAGAVFAMAVVAGLVGAKRTGRGGRIDFSASEAAAMLCGDSLSEYSLARQVPQHLGNSHPDHSPHGVYRCRDGWIFIAARNDDEWMRFVELLSRADLMVDENGFATSVQRVARRAEVDELVGQWTAKMDRYPAFEMLQSQRIPCAPAVTGEDIVKDPQLVSREFVTRTRVATTDRTRAVCSVPWMVGGRRPTHTDPPELGRDTHNVLHRVLGFADTEIESLTDAGILQ